MVQKFDVVVIGAGAAGMMCAAVAGQRGRRVLVLDHAKRIGEKIRISGGGRCNFTNIHTTAKNFVSANPHFAKSALSRYQPYDFIALIEKHKIAWHEKAKGQLFCDDSAQQIVDMLLDEMALGGVQVHHNCRIDAVSADSDGYVIETPNGQIYCSSVVIATGGRSIPKIGASGFGIDIAQQFGLNIRENIPALVPLTFAASDLERLTALAGISVPVRVSCGDTYFDEDMLFTHRGLSGPAILQISSYWRLGQYICIKLRPDIDFNAVFRAEKMSGGRQAVQTVLAKYLSKRLAQDVAHQFGFERNIADMSAEVIANLVETVENWQIKPSGSEGYRTAEVMLGGVDTAELNAKTMEAKNVKGLHFIGEVVDVTGWLGGYNFQWAWASGQAAGQVV